MNPRQAFSLINVVQLGRLDYALGLRVQQKLVAARKAGEIGNTLLLLEHTPVITLGRNATRDNMLASDELLRRQGVELFECDRGGDVTYHGPGQLVGYPIFDLRSFTGSDGKPRTIWPVEFVRRIEEVLVRTCADFGIATQRIEGLTGVWTNPPRSHGGTEKSTGEAKIAAIGVHISRGVTSHGFALNVTTLLEHFSFIVPCGIANRPVTSMEKELGPAATPPMQQVTESAARNFGRVFNSQVLWVKTLEELLGYKLDLPVRPPVEERRLRGEDELFLA